MSMLFVAFLGTMALLWAAAASAPASPVIGLQWSGYEGQEEEAEVIDRSGAKFLRYELNWGVQALRKVTHPTEVWKPYDNVFKYAWERGIRIYPYLYGRLDTTGRLPGTSEWNSTNGGPWETWLEEVVQRYGPNGSFWSGKSNPLPVITWEIWNEPNAGWNNRNGSTVEPDFYAKFLKASTEKLNAVTQAQAGVNTTILFGGLLELKNEPSSPPQTTMSAARFLGEADEEIPSLENYYTAVAQHPYVYKADDGNKPENTEEVLQVKDKIKKAIERVRDRMDEIGAGSKPIWINEIGWPAYYTNAKGENVNYGDAKHPAVSESIQAQLLGHVFNMIDNQSGGNDFFIGGAAYYFYRDTGKQEWDKVTGLRRAPELDPSDPQEDRILGIFRPSWEAFREQTGASSWPIAPNATTNSASNISYRTAKLNGSIDPNGLRSYYRFKWGKTDGYGSETSTGSHWENKTFSHSKTLNGLTPNTTYHYLLTATNNNNETDNGADKSFKTLAAKPILSGVEHGSPYVSEETGKVDVDAQINPNGFKTTYHLDWGATEGELTNSTPEVEMEYTGYTESKPVEATLEGLKGLSKYYYRLVAENSQGTTESSVKSFETPDWRPDVTLGGHGAAYVEQETGKIKLNGKVNPNGFATKVHFEWGDEEEFEAEEFNNSSPEIEIGNGQELVEVVQTIEGLKGLTTYHYRLVASNVEGTTTGEETKSFKTPDWRPSATTEAATGVAASKATLNARINPKGFATTYQFEYIDLWDFTSNGWADAIKAPTSPDSVGSGSQEVAVSQVVLGLQPKTPYRFRAVATNGEGDFVSVAEVFTTPPAAITSLATNIDGDSATLNGSVDPMGVSTSYQFEYGTTAEYGFKVPAEPTSIGSGTDAVAVSEPIEALQPRSTYHYRIVAISAGDTTYGIDRTFSTWGDWTLQSTPIPPQPTQTRLEGVSCPSASTCVAVGNDNERGKAFGQLWNGSEWKAVGSGIAGSRRGVACSSATECFLVGSSGSGAGEVPRADKWSGSTMLFKHEPVLQMPQGGSEARLNDVSCSSASACTAVGSYKLSGRQLTLAYRWNGSSWSLQSTPNPESGHVPLHGVSCQSASSCTAVGRHGEAAFAMHWNGTSWSISSVPNPEGASEVSLADVSCTSAISCLAVGSYFDTDRTKPLAARWNGVSWSLTAVPAPIDAVGNVSLAGVFCLTASNCKAAGTYTTEVNSFGWDKETRTLTEIWDGSAWTVQNSPNPEGKPFNGLADVSCTSATACTAVGSSGPSGERVTLGVRYE